MDYIRKLIDLNKDIELGTIYTNKLMPNEKVTINNITSKEMWGQTGKELVAIIKYNIIGDRCHTSTTIHNFLEKYEDTQTIRDNKLNQILGDDY